jgi:LPP20 lipoprotein
LQMNKVLLLLLLAGCSQLDTKPTLSDEAQPSTRWIYAPYEECQELEELCATGEAKSYSEADIQAKTNLASIFETRVQSEMSATMSSSQTFPWQGQVREEVQKSIKESVDQVLEMVQVKKHVKDKGLSYALASLNRQKASELIGSRISKLDHELEVLWAQKQRTNLRKIVKLNLEREKLNERYSIVSGQLLAERVKYVDILKWRETRPKAEPLILKVGQAPDWMTEKLKELLTEAGFRIVKGDATQVVSLNVDSIKEFLNVDGFEKYTFTLNMSTIEDGEKKKVISTSETVTGRTQADALLKVKNYFIDYIEQHLSELHLD